MTNDITLGCTLLLPVHTVNYVETLKAIAASVNVLEVDPSSGRSALHFASFWGHQHLIGFLTGDCKIPTDVQDDAGDTALHDAARFGHVEVIKALIAAGASKTVRNKAGETANEAALRFEKVGLDTLLA
jgi:cytochrome c peroxidase